MTIINKVSNKTLMPGITPIPDVPDAPTIGTATAGINSASVTFTAAATGGTVTTFTATSTPGSITGTSATSPITVSGLTGGTAYTFKVKGTNATATGPESSSSNSITALSTSYESIATVSLGSGGSSSTITFSSIPNTFKHLQIRGIAHGNTAGDQDMYMLIGASAVGTVNYSWHTLYGTGAGSAVGNTGGQGANNMVAGWNFVVGTGSTDVFSTTIIDILDYQSTTKHKTIRAISGADKSGSGTVGIYAGVSYDQAPAIDVIQLYPSGGSFAQWTHFALYGIKG